MGCGGSVSVRDLRGNSVGLEGCGRGRDAENKLCDWKSGGLFRFCCEWEAENEWCGCD